MRKYKQLLTQQIPIGRNIRICVLLFVFSILFNGCWFFTLDENENYDYIYSVKIINELPDTLALTVYRAGFISASDLYVNMVYPGLNEIFNIKPTSKLYAGEDPVEAYFADLNRDTVWCYNVDKEMRELIEIGFDTISGLIIPNTSSLKYTWVGPLSVMPDSVNNFFNYNSWHDSLISVDRGELVFTIK
jgi:hypothetical protein